MMTLNSIDTRIVSTAIEAVAMKSAAATRAVLIRSSFEALVGAAIILFIVAYTFNWPIISTLLIIGLAYSEVKKYRQKQAAEISRINLEAGFSRTPVTSISATIVDSMAAEPSEAPVLYTSNPRYDSSVNSRNFAVQAEILQDCEKAITDYFDKSLRNFNTSLAATNALKRRYRMIAEEIGRQYALPEVKPTNIPADIARLEVDQTFDYPRSLSKDAITKRLAGFSRGVGSGAARAYQATNSPWAIFFVAVAGLVGHVYLDAKYVRQLEELAGEIRLYYADALGKVRQLELVRETRLKPYVTALTDHVARINQLLEEMPVSSDTAAAGFPTRLQALSVEMFMLNRLLNLPIG